MNNDCAVCFFKDKKECIMMSPLGKLQHFGECKYFITEEDASKMIKDSIKIRLDEVKLGSRKSLIMNGH